MLKSAEFFQWKVQNLGRKLLKKHEEVTYCRLDDLMTYWPNLCWGFHVDVEIPKVSSIISWQITKQGMIQHSRSSVVYELIWWPWCTFVYIFCFLQFYHGGCPTVFLPNGSSRNLSYASPSPFSNPDLVRFDIIITLFNPQNGAAHCEIRSPTRISTEFYGSPHVCWINANVLPSRPILNPRFGVLV